VNRRLELLDKELVERILAEAFELIAQHGVKVRAPEVIELLSDAGAGVRDGIARIPETLARRCLSTVPPRFSLYDREGKAAAHYGGDTVQFDPGSSCVYVLDSETQQRREAQTCDLVRIVEVAESLPQFAAQSTAVVCDDAPQEIGDLYRLFVVLQYSSKPVITGAFSAQSLGGMIELLVVDAGGRELLKEKPRAVFDVCPSPPLNWSEFGAQNLTELARAGVPAEIISMPMAGATAPVTLAGAVVQHAAESISGIVIHQLAGPGSPVVWGAAPAILDMRTGTAPMGAIETVMLELACTQVGKHLGLPTHGYLMGSDARQLDMQAGSESGVSAVLGALGGINMISGAGMLDSLASFSVEKLVMDAEAIASSQRLLRGIEAGYDSLATAMFGKVGLGGEFLKLKETRNLFRREQYLPSSVIDRGHATSSIFTRARERVEELLSTYRRPEPRSDVDRALRQVMEREMRRLGLDPAQAPLHPREVFTA